MRSQRHAIGVDIGGSKINIAIVDELGQILRIKQILTNISDGPDGIQNHIANVIKSLSIGLSPIGIGIGAPGQIDPRNGIVLFAPNLNWRNVPLKSNLSRELNLDVVISDDVRAATIGEWRYGAGMGCQDFVCLFIGTGIGGGIVARGQLLEGCSNTAGEIGHMIIDINGPPCSCGSWGCLEALASGWSIAKYARESVTKDKENGKYLLTKCNGKIELIDAKMVAEASKDGDIISYQIMKKVSEAIVSGCINIVNILNPSRLIIGGGVIEGIPRLLLDIERGIQKRALGAALSKFQVLSTQLQKNAGVIGAARLYFEREHENRQNPNL